MSTEEKKAPLVLSILNCKPESLHHVVNLVPSSSNQFRFKGHGNTGVDELGAVWMKSAAAEKWIGLLS